MHSAVIVDNEKLAISLLKKQLEKTSNVDVVGTFTKPSQALTEIPQLQPDIVFLDIEMPGINGIELGTELLEFENAPHIIFVTAYDQYALEAFRLNAIHYILKPADQVMLREAMNRIPEKSSMVKSQAKEELRVELFGHLEVFLNGKELDIQWTTSKVEELFAILVLHRQRGISKEELVVALWSQSPWKKAQQSLYSSVYRLKKILNEHGIEASITNQKGRYFFKTDDLKVDIEELEQVIKVDDEQALRLYKGALLSDQNYPWCKELREYYKKVME